MTPESGIKTPISRLADFLALQRSTLGLLAMVILVGMGERMAERFLPIYILALAFWTHKRIDFINFPDQACPVLPGFFGRRFIWHHCRNGIIHTCLFPHPAGFVRIEAVVTDRLLISSGNMDRKPCQPVRGVT